MPKALTNDIIGILRLFEVAGELSSKKSISYTKETELRQGVRLISFIFERSKYYILIDPMAEDDEDYVLKQIHTDDSQVKGKLVENPHDEHLSYGLKFKAKDTYLFEVEGSKKRLDLELTQRYPELSRSTIQKYIKAGHVRVNDEIITQSKHEISKTDEIAMIPPQATDFSANDLPILYIDDNVIVINKPSGVLSHSKGAMNDEFTVADFFRRYTTSGLETNRPGIVHRLDRDTSGVMIGARNDETAVMLKKQFADRKTKKQYIAVVSGVPKVDTAVIDLPIGRNPVSPSKFRVDASGKEAKTTYEVLATNNQHSLVRLKPQTGRTHQLRVHMQYINTPILGDRVYGHEKADRLYLHAQRLEITIPTSKRQTFEAPVPKEFTKHFPGVGDV